MARKRIGMSKIRKMIQLKSTTEMSDRQIARALPPDTQLRVARRDALPGILAEIGLGGPLDDD